MTRWKPLGGAPARKLASVHEQPYQLAQWLARFARGYLEPVPDDSHTSLKWRRDHGVMATGLAETKSGVIGLSLQLRDLVLLSTRDGRVIDEFPMHGRTDKDAGEWVRNFVGAHNLDPIALDAPSPYEVPVSPYGKGEKYDALGSGVLLAEMARILDNADHMLSEVVAENKDFNPGPAPVRLWPHHFDLATIITLEEGDFETARAVGAGLAIPDKLYDEFYFYTYPWPRNTRKGLPRLSCTGKYQKEGFFGAVLPISKALKKDDQEDIVRTFFSETIEVFINCLKKESAE